MRSFIIVLVAGSALVGCAKTAAPPVARSAPAGPAIVHIVSRDQTLTIRSGADGLLYSLRDAQGKMLIADATASQFEQLQPELYRDIRHYIAVQNDAAWATSDEDDPIPMSTTAGVPVSRALKDARR